MITLSSDFAVQSQGCGVMEAVIRRINPRETVIHLMHGLPAFDVRQAAWALESAMCIEPGIHVCVVDPGVGTQRLGIAIMTARGDFLVGPDNGVLIPVARLLGGILRVHALENQEYMRRPVSPLFHGRDVFSPAAAHLSLGVKIERFGRKLEPGTLARAPYEEAVFSDGRIRAEVIHVNRFGTIHLNVLQHEFDRLNAERGESIVLRIGTAAVRMPYHKTFGDVAPGRPVLLKDDYSRIEVALNQGSFAAKYRAKPGETAVLEKA